LIVEPNQQQHPDFQRLHLDVAKLEEVTNDALSGFFSDPENRNNAKKLPYLKEIFYIAKKDAQYRNGEIGKRAHTHIAGTG
jgi:hypothetical protein